MSSVIPAHLSRVIWSFNVEVARYAHPAWLEGFQQTWPTRWARDKRMQSRYLITTHALGITQLDIMQSRFERIALLNAHDTHRLMRCWIALLCVRYLRANVVGKVARGNARVLGASTIDYVLAERETEQDGGVEALLMRDGEVAVPADLATLHRRLLSSIHERLSPEVAARFRLRFRPGCFDRAIPIHGVDRLESWLGTVDLNAHLSKEGACILSLP
ncbi:hypothetical protein [Burkholderia ubonensis]|uniref:hypothetical protein n=1 Tax=Burkholderia ubonensis TaxID=101571 RepID=UPI0012F770DE|nr:hypothetical protein [Burkholderia ubonensis]